MKLPHPLVPGASPLADDLDGVRRLEDAGAAAIVMRSLFEEQITREQLSEHMNLDYPGESFAEATSYFPSPNAFALGPARYLEHLRQARDVVEMGTQAIVEKGYKPAADDGHCAAQSLLQPCEDAR